MRDRCTKGHSRIEFPMNKWGQCPECVRAWVRKYRGTHKLEAFGRQIKHHYGVSLDEWNTMFQNQKGLCLGCYKHQSNVKEKFCIDHNHKTGEVRGLLCRKCNSALGLLSDDSQILRRLADYLDSKKENSLVNGL